MDNSTQLSSIQERFGGRLGLVTYWIVMLFILTAGISGNAVILAICKQPEHRRKEITPLIVNLAVADLTIVVFGYSATFSANARGDFIMDQTPLCYWSAIINGIVGIGSIVTMATINILVYRTTRRTVTSRLSTRSVLLVVCFIWVYSAALICPPLFGWNRIVLGASMVSCEPDWANQSLNAISYNVFLMFFGYFIPLAVIGVTFYYIRRSLSLPSVLQNTFQQKAHLELVRMMIGVTTAFVLSWTPYAIVCMVAMVTGRHVMKPFAAGVPALMAKASAIYNPVVYLALSKKFRNSLLRLGTPIVNRLTTRSNRVHSARTIQITVEPTRVHTNISLQQLTEF